MGCPAELSRVKAGAGLAAQQDVLKSRQSIKQSKRGIGIPVFVDVMEKDRGPEIKLSAGLDYMGCVSGQTPKRWR